MIDHEKDAESSKSILINGCRFMILAATTIARVLVLT